MIVQKDISVTPPQPNSYSQSEEKLNAISHAFGLLLSCIGFFLLLQNSHGDISRIVSFSIFATSGILLFISSTLYHSLTNKRAKKLFKLLDHCAIYLLIAGTYTPLLAVTLAGPLGYTLLSFIWLFALAGILFKIKFGNKYKKVSLATYIGMGFTSFGILGELYEALPEKAVGLLALGGLIYCLGVCFYVKKQCLTLTQFGTCLF